MPDLGPTQLAFACVRRLSDLVGQDFSVDPIIFVREHVPPCALPECAVMRLTEAWNFPGLLVATTARLALQLRTIPSKAKAFYSWDLEWLRAGVNWAELRSIYLDVRVPVFARSESHRRAIEHCWGRGVDGVSEDCDPHPFLEMINKDEKNHQELGVLTFPSRQGMA